jgi:hypothetical protein
LRSNSHPGFLQRFQRFFQVMFSHRHAPLF